MARSLVSLSLIFSLGHRTLQRSLLLGGGLCALPAFATFAALSGSRTGACIITGILLLVLSPHLLATHLLVVHRTSAVRSLDGLLVVHGLAGLSVLVVRVRVGVLALLLSSHASVRRLPAHSVAQVRAVVAAARLLTIGRWRLQDLRRVVA